MMGLSTWMHRLWSTLHWQVRAFWVSPESTAADPELRARASAALGAVAHVMAQLSGAQLLLWIGAPLVGAIALRWRPRLFAGAVLALWAGMAAVSLAVIE
jgi:hypothetical protein